MLKAVENLPSLRVECLAMWETICQKNKDKTMRIPVGDDEIEMSDVVEGGGEKREMDVEGAERSREEQRECVKNPLITSNLLGCLFLSK